MGGTEFTATDKMSLNGVSVLKLWQYECHEAISVNLCVCVYHIMTKTKVHKHFHLHIVNIQCDESYQRGRKVKNICPWL